MVSDKVFNTNGTQKIFGSDFPVISEDHLRVYVSPDHYTDKAVMRIRTEMLAMMGVGSSDDSLVRDLILEVSDGYQRGDVDNDYDIDGDDLTIVIEYYNGLTGGEAADWLNRELLHPMLQDQVTYGYLFGLDNYTVVSRDDYDLINNAAVFKVAPATSQSLVLQVGTTASEILTAPTDIGIVSANIVIIQRVEDSIDAINTVNTHIDNIDTVADDLLTTGHIETVSTNMDKVITVSDNIADVQVVAADLILEISDIETVADDLNEKVDGIIDSEIETVADSIINVDAVGDAIINHHMNLIGDDLAKASDGDPSTESFVSNAKIYAQSANTAAESAESSMQIVRDREDLMSPHYAAIDELGDATTSAALDRLNTGDTASNIDRLKTSADKLDRVYTSIDKLDRVHTSADKLDRVHTSIDNLDTVYDKRDNIDTVAGKATEIGRLGTADAVTDLNTLGTADVVSDMNTLGTAGNVTNMNTLAGISGNITTVAGISGNTTTVAGISADVTTVAGVSADVTTVATDLVGDDTLALSHVYNEMMSIIVGLSPVDQVLYDLITSVVGGYQRGDIDNDGDIDTGDASDVIRFLFGIEDSAWIRDNIMAPMRADMATYSQYFASNVITVANNVADVNTVGTDIASVNTVADSIDNYHLNLIGDDLYADVDGDPTTVSTVINAKAYADSALVSAESAETSRVLVDTHADELATLHALQNEIVFVNDNITALETYDDDIFQGVAVSIMNAVINVIGSTTSTDPLETLLLDQALGYARGDLNLDGTINIMDMYLALDFISQGEEGLTLNQSHNLRERIIKPMLADLDTYYPYFDSAIVTVHTNIDSVNTVANNMLDVVSVAGALNQDFRITPTGNANEVPITGPDGKLDVEWMNLDGEFVNMATGIITNSTAAISALFDTMDNANEIAGNDVEIATNTSAIADTNTAIEDTNAALSATVASLTEVINTTITPITDDLDGGHNAGSAFNYGIFNQAEQAQLVEASQFEYSAEIMRNLGGSGVTNSRQYTYGGDETYHQPHDIGYSAINQHNHNNYKRMVGQAETSCILNGYYLRTRHNDYNLNETVDGNFLATEFGGVPTVPPSVTAAGDAAAQVEEMRMYFKAYAARDTSIRDYRPYFEWSLSYIEMWIEAMDDDLTDPFASFRHSIDAASLRELLQKQLYLNQGGHKNRLENLPFFGQCLRYVDDEGVAHIGVLKYRMVTKNVGNVDEFDPQECLDQRKDYATYKRYNYNTFADMRKNRRARFRLKHHRDANNRVSMATSTPGILDEMMMKIPGLDGPSANLVESYTQYGLNETLQNFTSTMTLNASYYNRFYSMLDDDASNRQTAKRGFNDPMMFTALNTRAEVIDVNAGADTKRVSYAMPFELILRTPLEDWNPHNLMEHNEGRDAFVANQNAEGRFGTQAAPYHGYNTAHYYAFTPDSFFDGATLDGDPADTDGDALWVLSDMGNGAGVPVRNSGIHIHLPPIAGVSFGDDAVHGYNSGANGILRTRFPVYSTFWEGNASHAEMDARAEDIAEDSAGSAAVQATVIIENLLQPKVEAAIAAI